MIKLHTQFIFDVGLGIETLFLSFQRDCGVGRPVRMMAAPLTFLETPYAADRRIEPFIGPSREDLCDGVDVSVDQFLQAMLDAAWNRGLRPKSFEDHNNELKAVRFHLEDMRLLAKVKK